jgi:hypothetical protein
MKGLPSMTQSLPLCRRAVVFGSSLAVLILLISAPAVRADDKTPAAAPAQSNADKIDAMLKAQNYFYQRIETPGQPTMFKVMIQDDKNRTSIVIIKVLSWTWKYADGTAAESLYGYVQTVQSSKISPAVGLKVAEYNDTLVINSCCVNAEAGVFVTFGCYARGLDAESLASYIVQSHWASVALKDLLDPIMKAEEAEK